VAWNRKKTSAEIASRAGTALANPKESAIARSMAASALSQTGNRKQTGAAMESAAARVVFGKGYSANTRKLAGSVLSQSNRAR
jgi:hypothetical protein